MSSKDKLIHCFDGAALGKIIKSKHNQYVKRTLSRCLRCRAT
jgi:hypothetical protein